MMWIKLLGIFCALGLFFWLMYFLELAREEYIKQLNEGDEK